ncbi:type II toxin-antitoxin system RelE/ParE family toxin [uncultured Selenomonas sp.]|uniref:type II toxin-antitoxin system RelE/ParE family toxin n=1 Tax=uncultured Selenomonas sp. TaxID=159275 RepID=UPI0025CDA638|nr:type II toxin-antitoxin system RelE/ParE family toxin [uncultured Selenomonas sp.]
MKGGADTKLTRQFILGTAFERGWKELGLTDEDLRRLQRELLQNPKAGDVMRGTGRLRKMRFSFEHQGKSGSTRVCYVDFEVQEAIYLLAVFAKNQKENLSKAERNLLKKKIDILEASIERRKSS